MGVLIIVPRSMIAMRFKMRLFVLPVAYLSLVMFGSGCDSSTVNESKSPETATATLPKDAPPPPATYKEFYERQLKAGGKSDSAKKGAPASAAEAPKGGDAPKP
jgi:hypothetical protein